MVKAKVDLEKLYDLAGGQAVTLAAEMFEFKAYWLQHPEIGGFLNRPEYHLTARREIIEKLGVGHSDIFQQLLALLLENGLLTELPWLTEKFLLLVEKRQQLQFAELETAGPLGLAELEKIKKTFGPRLRYRQVIKPEIGGGFILKFIDGKVFDASVSGELDRLRLEMAK